MYTPATLCLESRSESDYLPNLILLKVEMTCGVLLGVLSVTCGALLGVLSVMMVLNVETISCAVPSS